ncbi:hypothetical protein BH23CHL2_BH23CHL2_08160 [soil metagenome]
MSGSLRFQIDRAAWVKPLLVLFTATESRSWIELRETGLAAQYGWYRLEVPSSAIVGADRDQWPWYAGIGWRTNFRTVIGLIGSYRGIVRLEIDPPQRARLLRIPLGLTQLYISFEDADGFLEALGRQVDFDVARPSTVQSQPSTR